MLIAVIAILAIKNLVFMSKSETTEGVVVDRRVISGLAIGENQQGNLSSSHREKGQEVTAIEFSTDDGNKHQISHTNIGISIGDIFTVRYDPKNPERAHVDNFVNVWIQVLLLSVVFAVLLIARFVV